MDDKIKRVVQSIFEAPDDEEDHAPFRDRISDYVNDLFKDRATPDQYADLEAHLNQCPDCYAEAKAQQELVARDREGKLIEPPRPPQLDFSFLEELPAAPSLWVSVGTQVRRLIATVTAELGATDLTFRPAQIFEPYLRQIAPAVVLRGDPLRELPSESLLQVLDLPDPDENIRIRLLKGPIQTGRGVLQVQVQDLHTLSPLAQVRISLRDKINTLLKSVLAVGGVVTFTDLALGEYTIQIRHQSNVWELPVTLERSN